jgi:hypothetical protein
LKPDYLEQDPDYLDENPHYLEIRIDPTVPDYLEEESQCEEEMPVNDDPDPLLSDPAQALLRSHALDGAASHTGSLLCQASLRFDSLRNRSIAGAWYEF